MSTEYFYFTDGGSQLLTEMREAPTLPAARRRARRLLADTPGARYAWVDEWSGAPYQPVTVATYHRAETPRGDVIIRRVQ